ncbi:MAG: DUF6629 family protein [Gallionella sp.]|jgi:hypothetical protein
MCFSATASFTAGVSLTAMGLIIVKMARRRAEIPFAAIPLLFGIQQLIEGILWLSFRFEAHLLNTIMTYLFTLFSHVLWPILLPLSIGLLETDPLRKKIIYTFQITGAAVGAYLLYFIVRFPITSEINVHVMYIFPHFHKPLVLLLYIVATCVSALFSSHRIVNLFGVIALLLFVVSYWFYTVAFFSVWCFFCAILSAVIYLHFKFGQVRRPELTAQQA